MKSSTPDQRSLLQKILDLYVYSSLHIGLCAFAFAAFGFLFYGKEIDLTYSLCVGFATIALYSIHRLVGINKVNTFKKKGRFSIIKKYKNHIWAYFVLSSIFTIWNFLHLVTELKFMLLGIGLLSISYTLPFYRGKRLRDFNYIKIILIAFVWTLLCIVIPAYLVNELDFSVNLLSIACILFFIGITLPFDIRDIDADKSIEVKTIPIILGAERSHVLAKYLLLLAIICIVIYGISYGFTLGIYSWFLALGITFYLVRQYRIDYEDWYCSILLDGTISLFFIVFVGINILFSFI